MTYKGSFYWAKADGIEMEPCKNRGTAYLIPCEVCGEIIRKPQYSRKRNYICDYCKGLIKKKEKIVLEHLDGVETKEERRFRKAVENIEKQVKNFKAYEKAIEVAKTRQGRYGSIPEAMVAIELIKNKHKIIPQQRVGKYRVDFVIPEIKLVVEVDGKIFHQNNREKAYDRDAAIQIALGTGWKIIHIPAELVAKRITRLETAIRTMLERP